MARNALEAARARNAAARAAARKAAGSGSGRNAGSGRISTLGNRGRGTVAGRLGRRRWSGPGPDGARDPQPIGDAVKRWVSANAAAKELAKASLVSRWRQIVGPEIADHCSPLSLVDGQLLVQAESTAWATQLRMLSRSLIAQINTDLGRGTVTRLIAKGPTGPSWRFGNRHVPGRGPRDTYG